MTIEIGKVPPAFTLKTQDGESVALEDFKGQDVVIYFYPRDNTPGCTKEACAFRDLWKGYEERGVAVVGISPDSTQSHHTFRRKYGLPFTLLSDPDKKVMMEYGAYGEKVLYGRKTEGTIRSTVWVGPDGKVRKHWRRVSKAADHPGKVLEAIERESD